MIKALTYLFAKTRLLCAGFAVSIARVRMNRILKSSRGVESKIDRSYENFLKKCKSREKEAVNLKRLKNVKTGKPILKLDLEIEHYIVNPQLASKITRLEAEMALVRHRYGDWGECDIACWRENNKKAKMKNGIVRSRYPLLKNGFFIVETDRKNRIAVMYPEGEPA